MTQGLLDTVNGSLEQWVSIAAQQTGSMGITRELVQKYVSNCTMHMNCPGILLKCKFFICSKFSDNVATTGR